jgi:hypothetical protein
MAMASNQLRFVKLIGGVALVLIGLLWALQGVGVLGGSTMSGHSQWLLIGAVAAVVGLWLIRTSIRRAAPH